MKFDMGGAGAVLGAARAIAELAPPVETHFIIASCENMVSAEAFRPGDILTACNGKTIEIINTDAEGRLTLADALVYADRLGDCDAVRAPNRPVISIVPDRTRSYQIVFHTPTHPEACAPPSCITLLITSPDPRAQIVDIATLTGACIVALGNEYGAMYTDNDELLAQLTASAAAGGEPFWRMPLAPEYAEGLKSPLADLKNLAMGGGGSITAALFLKEFVGGEDSKSKDAAWAHLDIPGPVWNFKTDSATGFAVRTLTGLIEGMGKEE